MMNSQKIWSSGALVLLVCLIGFFVLRPFFHQNSTVNLRLKLKEYKVNGVPDFSLLPYDTKTFLPGASPKTLHDFKGDLILINFWATWCAPCIKEFPSLVELSRQFGAKKIIVIAISVDKNFSEIKSFLGAKGIPPTNFTILLDPNGGVASTYGTLKIPETYIIDGHYKLLRKVIDEQNWISPDFLTFLGGFLSKGQGFLMIAPRLPLKVGILGGGQLARMMALAAHDLGVRPFIFAGKATESACQVTSDIVLSSEPNALENF